MELISPAQLQIKYPTTCPATISKWRTTAKQILQRKDPRLVAIVGPCSIHDPKSALEYAENLKKITPQIESHLFPIMRLFFEKPRTRLGWKGMLNDPQLDGSNDIAQGLETSRKLLIQIAELGVPCATEILEPLSAPYFEDLLTWGLIGARTSASQPHRQIGSSLDFPIGYKNDCFGAIDEAISGILSAQIPHTYLGINSQGKVASLKTEGNPYSHLVLRGGIYKPNYDERSIQHAIAELNANQISTGLLIDCSHGNSDKDHTRQPSVLASILELAEKHKEIAGFMLESHLFSGKQQLGEDPSILSYGISITDSCLGWEETSELLRSISMSSVQN